MNSTTVSPLIETVLKERRQSLDNLASILKSISIHSPTTYNFDLRTFEINESGWILPKEFLEFLAKCKEFNSCTLYVIETAKPVSTKVVYNAFRGYKSQVKGTPALSKDNKLETAINEASLLYVGSKLKDLPSRMKQHFGLTSPSVYSLHLLHWFPKEIEIRVTIYEIEGLDSKHAATRSALEFIEQGFWRNLTPMFGKSS